MNQFKVVRPSNDPSLKLIRSFFTLAHLPWLNLGSFKILSALTLLKLKYTLEIKVWIWMELYRWTMFGCCGPIPLSFICCCFLHTKWILVVSRFFAMHHHHPVFKARTSFDKKLNISYKTSHLLKVPPPLSLFFYSLSFSQPKLWS